MEYAKKDKMSLEEGIKREWIITNGLGGYCSSTIIGANTRKNIMAFLGSTTYTSSKKASNFIKTRRKYTNRRKKV